MKLNRHRLLLAMANECMMSKDLAEKSGVSLPALTNIKSGKREPRPDIVGKLAKALNVTPEYLTEKE